MPADPVVWTPETREGHMKHTFTDLRRSFPNESIHFLILDRIIPLRVELINRPERMSPARWESDLATTVQDGLEAIRRGIQEFTHQSPNEDLASHEERRQSRQRFINHAINPETSLEKLAATLQESNSDALLPSANFRVGSVHFDYEGNTDPDMAQPTPGRVKNTDVRAILIGLDGLVVKMSTSGSADHPRTINEYDAAQWLTFLAKLNKVVQRAASKKDPVLPTALTRGQLDSGWNADGLHDPAVDDGHTQSGEPIDGSAGFGGGQQTGQVTSASPQQTAAPRSRTI